MILYNRPRGGGKTTELAKRLRENTHSCLIVATGTEKRRLERLFKLTPEEANRIVLASDLEASRGLDIREFMVDDIDRVFAMLTGIYPGVATVSAVQA